MTATFAEFRGLAGPLLDEMDPDDVDELLARRADRDELLDALADLAGRAEADLATRGVTVPPHRRRTLLLACLSLRPDAYGVKARPDRAAATYLTYLPLSHADPRDLVPAAVHHADDLTELVGLLTRSRWIRDDLCTSGATGPPFLVEPVALAVAAVAARDTGPDPSGDRPADRARWAAAASWVLARGAALARDHAESGRTVPGLRAALPIVGNGDFLVLLAGYRMALARPGWDTRPPDRLATTAELDELDELAARIADEVGAAMHRPTGVLSRVFRAEPDVLAGPDRYVTGLGDEVSGSTGRLLRLAYTVRTRHARPRRIERPDALPDERLRVPDGAARHADLDRLVCWLVAGLFERATPALRGPLVTWLSGRGVADDQDHLRDLLRMLRVGVYRLEQAADGAGDGAPARPRGPSPAELSAVVRRLTSAVRPEDLTGHPGSDARRLAHEGLPPLWTRRRAVVRLLTAAQRVRRRGESPQTRTVLARAGCRAPLQYLLQRTDRPAAPCCPPGTATGPGRPPAEAREPCPHRPWTEMGVVETYRTLADDTGLSSESVRQYLRRHRGDDLELLLGVRSGLRPEDC